MTEIRTRKPRTNTLPEIDETPNYMEEQPMTAAITDPRGEAQQKWDGLRGAFARADEILADIIRTRAWEPLGYPTFAEAWSTEMRGVRLAAEIRSHVVYQMFDDGLDTGEVVDALGIGSGLAHDSVDVLREKKDAGVPPKYATPVRRRTLSPNETNVKGHVRRKPSPPQYMHLRFTRSELSAFKAKALHADVDLEQFAAQAVRDAIETL